MEDYEPVFRAIGHFIHSWGRIDRFESLNEHWLELEAQIRTDFNIFGTKLDFVRNLKSKCAHARLLQEERRARPCRSTNAPTSPARCTSSAVSAIPWWSSPTAAPAPA